MLQPRRPHEIREVILEETPICGRPVECRKIRALTPFGKEGSRVHR
jgi:hypothetical protein